jgi:ABC-2 type transport system permease protein
VTTSASVARAYAWMKWNSLRNLVVQRVKRLKQPKYLFGALAGGAYLYFFLFRHMFNGGPGRGMPNGLGLSPDLAPDAMAVASVVAFVFALGAWVVPSARASLQFSEPEVAFLFPAPVTRRTLIHLKLLQSQLGIFITAFIMALVLRRASFLPGNQVLHAAGWWLILSVMNLHFLSASFARERLLDLGVSPWRRRLLIAAIVAVVAVACWWWLRMSVALPTSADTTSGTAVLHYVGNVLRAPPLGWVLLPFRWAVAPLFATDAVAFARALWPVLLLLAAHYVWVVRADVAFEEATLDASRQRAERIVAMRSGKMRLGNTPGKPRTAPFVLASQGFVPTAFLWKGLIALGSFYRLRTWLIACAIVVIGGRWMASDPARQQLLHILGGSALAFGGWMFFAGPMFMQRGLRQTIEHMDILKAGPLKGWQIVLGELMTPMTLMTFAQWLLLLIAAMAFGGGTGSLAASAANLVTAAIGVALLAPPLCGLMLCVPFAGLIVFPAFTGGTQSGTGAGIEVMGQRLIFFAAYLLVLGLALVPAGAIGAIAFLAGHWLLNLQLALILAAVFGGLVMVVELAAAVWWLGERVEKFDVSAELPR